MMLSHGGTPFDFLLMALVNLERGDVAAARSWFDTGTTMMAADPRDLRGLAALRDEAAAALLGKKTS